MNFINIITITIIIIMSTIITIICTDFSHTRNMSFLTSEKGGPSCLNSREGGGELIWVMPESKHSFFREVIPYSHIFFEEVFKQKGNENQVQPPPTL